MIALKVEGIVTQKSTLKQVLLQITQLRSVIVELTANPNQTSGIFVEWKGDVTGTENPVEITIDKAKIM